MPTFSFKYSKPDWESKTVLKMLTCCRLRSPVLWQQTLILNIPTLVDVCWLSSVGSMSSRLSALQLLSLKRVEAFKFTFCFFFLKNKNSGKYQKIIEKTFLNPLHYIFCYVSLYHVQLNWRCCFHILTKPIWTDTFLDLQGDRASWKSSDSEKWPLYSFFLFF